MPRIARKNQESCYFHIIVQGYEKEYIFNEDYLKNFYLNTLLNESKKFEIELLEYCIMRNHAHVLLYCEKISQMSLYMKNVNTIYAIFYNKEKNRVGYVFRDRFLSEAIVSQKHLYSCIPYIHMNPVVAGIVAQPADYKFSSYNNFINKEGFVTESVIIKLFGDINNYKELFNFLHLETGSGLDYKKDTKKLNIYQAQNIIEKILKEYCISSLKNESRQVQKYFFQKFIKKNISISHIEKILKIDHKKIKNIINNLT